MFFSGGFDLADDSELVIPEGIFPAQLPSENVRSVWSSGTPAGASSSCGIYMQRDEDLILPASAPSKLAADVVSKAASLISAKKSSRKAKVEVAPSLLSQLSRSSPRLKADPSEHNFAGLRSYSKAPVLGVVDHKKGQKRPQMASQEEAEAWKVEIAVREASKLITPAMADRVVVFHTDEKEAIGPTVHGERLVEHLRRHAGSGAQMRLAVSALLSLAMFAQQNFGLNKENFEFSSGLISIYLSSMTALTMPRSRLSALRFGQRVFGAFCNATDPVLDPYLTKVSKGGHAPATPLKCALHVCFLASESTSTIIRVWAASFLCMMLTSLRYCDVMRAGAPKRTPQAFDGKSRKGKMSSLPMLWYCPLKDFTGSETWSTEWIEQLTILGRDHLFPNFDGTSIGDATAWSVGHGPPDKHKVYGALIYMLTLPPLSLPVEEAKKFVKLHGMRRIVPILARLFSSVLGLTVEDRNELGRWAYTSQGAMPNLYSDEANRPNQINVRERVLTHARTIFARYKSDYVNLDLHDSYSMCYGDGLTSFADPEPGLDNEELTTEKWESDSESDDEADSASRELPEGFKAVSRETRSGRSYKVYHSPGGSVAGRSIPEAKRYFARNK